jgi:2-oxoglutarate ferredoxin oxidoreductase subunit alpha
VSDSREGAQKAGQTFGILCAKMRDRVWTVDIISAEIKSPSRSRAGHSGNRIRFGTNPLPIKVTKPISWWHSTSML